MADTLFRLDVNDVDSAFAHNEFRLFFQPQIDLATGRMTAAEALVRWQHPKFGLLPPGLFLDFLEAAGRMPHLTAFVFREALAAASIWNRHGRAWTSRSTWRRARSPFRGSVIDWRVSST